MTIYRFDLEGRDTGSGFLRDPVLRGIFDSSGTRIDDAWDGGGGEGYNAPHLDQNVQARYAAVASAPRFWASRVASFPAARMARSAPTPLSGANLALENRD